MNWAAVSTVTVLLFLFGMSLQASWQLEGLINQFGSQLEVSVYLGTGVEAKSLQPLVMAMSDVVTVKAIPKEEAWAGLVKEMGISDISGATQQLNGNPLVDELKVKARTPESVSTLAEQLRKLQGVDEVQYIDEAVKRIAQLNQGLNWISVTITTVLTLTAVAVITTTIRLIVMARRREIEIMQLVGATTAWIYLPFILQGITFGVAGAAIAWGLIGGVERFFANLLVQQPEFIQFLTSSAQSNRSIWLLPLILLGFGGAIGVIGSLFAVRRFAVR